MAAIPSFTDWLQSLPANEGPQLRSYTPTMRERIPAAVQEGLEFVGVGRRKANTLARRAADVLDWTPAGAAAAAYDAGAGAALKPTAGGKAAALGGGLAMAALGAVPGGRKVAQGVEKAAGKGIIAYHGSPHTFDRFSLDKIGTGEGAQAYGHGLYFAEKEDVARSYRQAGQQYASAARSGDVAAAIAEAGGDIDAAIAKEMESYRKVAADPAIAKYAPEYKKIVDALQEAKSNNALGSMYQVRINADPNEFLDWDAPLGDQKDSVIRAVQATTFPPFREGVMQDALRGKPANEVLRQLHGINVNGPDISDRLMDAGIPGIKYLDQGSRTAGEGSRNYVVFDDKLIDILKRYGWAPGLAIPAAALPEIQKAREESGGIPSFSEFLATQGGA